MSYTMTSVTFTLHRWSEPQLHSDGIPYCSPKVSLPRHLESWSCGHNLHVLSFSKTIDYVYCSFSKYINYVYCCFQNNYCRHNNVLVIVFSWPRAVTPLRMLVVAKLRYQTITTVSYLINDGVSVLPHRGPKPWRHSGSGYWQSQDNKLSQQCLNHMKTSRMAIHLDFRWIVQLLCNLPSVSALPDAGQ